MDIIYIAKSPYEIQEQKEVPVWYTRYTIPAYTGPFQALPTMKKENVCGFKTLILYYDTNLKFQTRLQQSLDPQQSADHRLINTALFHT
jgi:hypothetical protein